MRQAEHSRLKYAILHLGFLEAFQYIHPMKVNTVDFYSTAENIAHYMLQELIPGFERFSNVSELRIRLRETENTFAEAVHAYNN